MMDDYFDMKLMRSGPTYKISFWTFVSQIVIIVLAILFSGCTTTKYVPVETVRTEYKTIRDSFIQKDSIFVKDSVLVESKGDTIHWHHWHTEYRDRWRDKIVTDSFIKVDSIQVPYPVERKLSKWEQTKIDWGGEAIVMLIVILFIIVWLIVKRYLNLRR